MGCEWDGSTRRTVPVAGTRDDEPFVHAKNITTTLKHTLSHLRSDRPNTKQYVTLLSAPRANRNGSATRCNDACNEADNQHDASSGGGTRTVLLASRQVGFHQAPLETSCRLSDPLPCSLRSMDLDVPSP